MTHGDAYQTSFVLRYYIDIFRAGNWSGWGTLPMFYGLPRSLFFTEGFFLPGVFAIILGIVSNNVFLLSNLISVITVFISLISSYIYFYYLFKKPVAALGGALVFVCNPYISARFPDHLLLVSLQYIPLILLSIELYIDRQSAKWLWIFAAACLLQLYGSSVYYTIYLTMLLPVYIVVRFWQKKFPVRKLVNFSVLGGLLLLVAGSSGFIYFYHNIGQELSYERTLDQIAYAYSARVSDWWFMWPGSLVYGEMKEIAVKWWPQVVRSGLSSEHNLFSGLSTAIVGLLGFLMIVRRKANNLGWLFVAIMIVSWWLSLGPDVVFSGQLKFPGLYRVFYALHPLAKYLRVSTRFAILVYLGLGFMVGLVVSKLESKKSRLVKAGLGVLLVFIMVEYTGKSLEFAVVDQETRRVYQDLEKSRQVKVIVDWPMNNRIPQFMAFARSQELDAHYLLWASGFHSKKLLNGYTGYIPEIYFRRAALVATQFPAWSGVRLLRQWGADALVLHAEETANGYDYAKIKTIIASYNLPVISESEKLTIFDLTGDYEAE